MYIKVIGTPQENSRRREPPSRCMNVDESVSRRLFWRRQGLLWLLCPIYIFGVCIAIAKSSPWQCMPLRKGLGIQKICVHLCSFREDRDRTMFVTAKKAKMISIALHHSWAPLVKKTSIGSIPIIDCWQKTSIRSMVVRKKILSRWIDTIGQKSNFFTDDQYYRSNF
jgi:hypothetical protein